MNDNLAEYQFNAAEDLAKSMKVVSLSVRWPTTPGCLQAFTSGSATRCPRSISGWRRVEEYNKIVMKQQATAG